MHFCSTYTYLFDLLQLFIGHIFNFHFLYYLWIWSRWKTVGHIKCHSITSFVTGFGKDSQCFMHTIFFGKIPTKHGSVNCIHSGEYGWQGYDGNIFTTGKQKVLLKVFPVQYQFGLPKENSLIEITCLIDFSSWSSIKNHIGLYQTGSIHFLIILYEFDLLIIVQIYNRTRYNRVQSHFQFSTILLGIRCKWQILEITQI